MRQFRILLLAYGLCVLWLLSAVAAPSIVRAQGGTATFFVAHPGTHAEATQNNPLRLSGIQPIVFEVRMRDAGAGAKAGWQTSLAIDACEFETPAVSALVLGDMFGSGIPVSQVLPVENNVLKIRLGQVMLFGSTTRADGLLATVTLTPKAQRSCPSGGAGTASNEIRFADVPETLWSAPGGVKLAFLARPGHVIRSVSAVTLAQSSASDAGIDWPLILLMAAVALAGLIVLTRILSRRSQP